MSHDVDNMNDVMCHDLWICNVNVLLEITNLQDTDSKRTSYQTKELYTYLQDPPRNILGHSVYTQNPQNCDTCDSQCTALPNTDSLKCESSDLSGHEQNTNLLCDSYGLAIIYGKCCSVQYSNAGCPHTLEVRCHHKTGKRGNADLKKRNVKQSLKNCVQTVH